MLTEKLGSYHRRFRCALQPGEGSRWPVVVTSGGQVNANDVFFSYARPEIISITPNRGRTDGLTSSGHEADATTRNIICLRLHTGTWSQGQ